jgi:hypothetical protein
MALSTEQINKPADFFQSCEPQTCLQHGDLRLKNSMVNEKGQITDIIDWEECISSITVMVISGSGKKDGCRVPFMYGF